MGNFHLVATCGECCKAVTLGFPVILLSGFSNLLIGLILDYKR